MGQPGVLIRPSDRATKAEPPGVERPASESLEATCEAVLQETDDVNWVMRGNIGGEAGADADGAVDREEGHCREIVGRLNALAVLLQVLQENGVLLAEDRVHDRVELGVNIPRARSVLAAEEAAAELADGPQEIHVVRADEVLGHADDRGVQGRLAVMIGRVLGHVA